MPMLIIALLMLVSSTALAGQPPAGPAATASPPQAIVAALPNTITTATSATAKVCQLVGEYDRQLGLYTESRTASRFNVYGTDLGANTVFDGRLWFFFGDTWKGTDDEHFTPTPDQHNDSMAFAVPKSVPFSPGSIRTGADQCLKLEFVMARGGTFRPIVIEGGDVGGAGFEVPTAAFETDAGRGGKALYLFFKTDSVFSAFPVTFASGIINKTAMTRSVLAKRNDSGSFDYLYDFSTYPEPSAVYPDTRPAFITNSAVVVDSADIPGLPIKGKGVLVLGSGLFRLSHVYLAFISLADLEKRELITLEGKRYRPQRVYFFAGRDADGKPIWNDDWQHHSEYAQPIIDLGDKPDVGEISVVLDRETGFWYMTHYSSWPPGPKAIHFRFAPMATPWNFSAAQELFVPSIDPPVGYGQFIHVAEAEDGLSDPGNEATQGAAYGPYLIPSIFRTLPSRRGEVRREIFFTLSTWNPYTVELMKSVITIQHAPAILKTPSAP